MGRFFFAGRKRECDGLPLCLCTERERNSQAFIIVIIVKNFQSLLDKQWLIPCLGSRNPDVKQLGRIFLASVYVCVCRDKPDFLLLLFQAKKRESCAMCVCVKD